MKPSSVHFISESVHRAGLRGKAVALRGPRLVVVTECHRARLDQGDADHQRDPGALVSMRAQAITFSIVSGGVPVDRAPTRHFGNIAKVRRFFQ